MDVPRELQIVLALLAGVAIAAAAGLRAFLPLFLIGLAARFELIGLHANVQWLTDTNVLIALGAATVLEIAADKIPIVDHALDSVATFIRPVAAWIGAYAMLIHWPAPWAAAVATLLAGGSLALHALKGVVRVGSTASTAGTANPAVSATEDAIAFSLVAMAVLVPALALALIIGIVWFLRRRRRRRSVTA
jgi:preprotein translocase subunit YajC